MEQVRRREAEQSLNILERTEKERLQKKMLERLRRFNAMIARRDHPQRQEKHTH